MVLHAGRHDNFNHGISGQDFSIISLFPTNRQLQLGVDGKCSQEYDINAIDLGCCILAPMLFLIHMIGLLF